MPVAVSGLVEWLLTDTDMIVILIVKLNLIKSEEVVQRGRVGQPPSSHLALILVNSPCPGLLCTVTHDWA